MPTPWKESYDQPRQHIAEKAMAPHSSTRLENPMDGGAWWAAVHGALYSHHSVSQYQRPSQIPKSLDAQVLYIK